MKITPPAFLPFLALLSLSLGLPARAGDVETTVGAGDIPAAAAKAIHHFAGEAKIVKISKETDDGKVAYEATLITAEGVREVSVDAVGKLLSDERTVVLGAVPEKARKAIQERAEGGKIVKIEQVIEDGKTTYEALLDHKKQREEVVVAPDGKIVKVEKKSPTAWTR